MLQRLVIKNYALINELDIAVSDGLTIITGETGAGKSILLGALSLILGQRADSHVLLDKERKCIIEGEFELSKMDLQSFFTGNDLDYSPQTVIRREISPDGKSRAFINDTPVNLSQLKELSSNLVDIHSQHDTLLLNEGKFQLDVVDSWSRNSDIKNAYKQAFKEYSDTKTFLNKTLEEEKTLKNDQDYWQFLFNELDEAKLDGLNQVDIEQKLEVLNHAEEIKQGLLKTLYTIEEGEVNLFNQLSEVRGNLQGLVRFYPSAEEFTKRINSINLELKDISSELKHEEEKVHFDPELAQELSNQLDMLYKLQKKHKVNDVESLIVLREDLQEKLSRINLFDEEIERLGQLLLQREEKLTSQSGLLTSTRQKSIPVIETEVNKLLAEVGMPNGVLKIETSSLDNFTLEGKDKIRFLFSANKGSELKELNKVASGGELSRLMLCIKAIIANVSSLPTIIFDEIDTGISGETALKVGNVMNTISKGRQVLAITHLPQMAGKGKEHYFVYKVHHAHQTVSSIKKLNKDERIVEIAKMLSGENPTAAAMENAKELLN